MGIPGINGPLPEGYRLNALETVSSVAEMLRMEAAGQPAPLLNAAGDEVGGTHEALLEMAEMLESALGDMRDGKP